MSDREGPSHLRLVASQTEDSREQNRRLPSPQKQLSFPYPDSFAVIFVLIDSSIGTKEFTKIMENYAPSWIIDVRAVPRLDTIAASRASAFSLFERSRALYVDLFGRLGIRSYRSAESNPAFWGNAAVDQLRSSKRKGPYLFLFDNERLMKTADAVLQDLMEPVVGKQILIDHLPHEEAE